MASTNDTIILPCTISWQRPDSPEYTAEKETYSAWLATARDDDEFFEMGLRDPGPAERIAVCGHISFDGSVARLFDSTGLDITDTPSWRDVTVRGFGNDMILPTTDLHRGEFAIYPTAGRGYQDMAAADSGLYSWRTRLSPIEGAALTALSAANGLLAVTEVRE